MGERGDSPVEPATTIESVPWSNRWAASACAPSRSSEPSRAKGVAIAVSTAPNLPVMSASFRAALHMPRRPGATVASLATCCTRATRAGRAACCSGATAGTRRAWWPRSHRFPSCRPAAHPAALRSSSSRLLAPSNDRAYPSPRAAYLHRDRGRRDDGPVVRRPDLQGRPRRGGVRRGGRGRRRARPDPVAHRQRHVRGRAVAPPAGAVRRGGRPATNPSERGRLEPGVSIVTHDMVARLEELIDRTVAEHPLPNEFIVPGETTTSASLDVARGVVRRAERPDGRLPRRRRTRLRRPPPLPQPAVRPAVLPGPVAGRPPRPSSRES